VNRVALVLIALVAVACDEETDAPGVAQRKAECRQLMDHIVRITPRPGGERPESDPAQIQRIVAQLPVEDIEQCAAIKDPVQPGQPAPPPGQTPRVIACMQAAGDIAALRACIPAQAE
jgi:hypothetical protein